VAEDETADKVTDAPVDASAGETAVIAAVEEPKEADGAVPDNAPEQIAEEENATTTDGKVAEGETVDKVTGAPADASIREMATVEEPKETDGVVPDKGCGIWFC